MAATMGYKLKATIAVILSLSLLLFLAYSPNLSKTSVAPVILTQGFLFACLSVKTSVRRCEETQLVPRRTLFCTPLFRRPPPYVAV
jgi:hypothetical protein